MRIYCRIFIILALLFSASVFAVPYPIITNIEIADSCGGCSGTYHFSQSIIDVNTPEINVVATKPVGIGYIYRFAGGTLGFGMITYGSYYVNPDGHSTVAEQAIKAYNKGYKNLGGFGISAGGTIYCFGYVQGNINGSGSVPSTSLCTPVPPAVMNCSIKSESILFDHGSLNTASAEGATGNAMMQIDCTKDASVNFSLLSGSQDILLAPSGKATIQVNHQTLGQTVSLLSGSNQIQVTDTLSGIDQQGLNSGSDVLIMNFN